MTEALVNVFIPQPDDPRTSASAAKAQASALVVASDADYAGAGAVLIEIKHRRKVLDDKRKELVKPIDEARERVQALFRAPLLELDECERIVKRKLVDYQSAQEERRRAEQAKADEAARKERERLAEQAREAERKAREKADADRRAAEEAAAAGRAAEAAKLAARADATEAKAAEKAEQLQERAATVVAPIIQREAPKVPGISPRVTYSFEIVDESQVPDAWWVIDAKAVGAFVKSTKGARPIPGIRIFEVSDIAASKGGPR